MINVHYSSARQQFGYVCSSDICLQFSSPIVQISARGNRAVPGVLQDFGASWMSSCNKPLQTAQCLFSSRQLPLIAAVGVFALVPPVLAAISPRAQPWCDDAAACLPLWAWATGVKRTGREGSEGRTPGVGASSHVGEGIDGAHSPTEAQGNNKSQMLPLVPLEATTWAASSQLAGVVCRDKAQPPGGLSPLSQSEILARL